MSKLPKSKFYNSIKRVIKATNIVDGEDFTYAKTSNSEESNVEIRSLIFNKCTFNNINFFDCDFTQSHLNNSFVEGCSFNLCKFYLNTFFNVQLTGNTFNDCIIHNNILDTDNTISFNIFRNCKLTKLKFKYKERNINKDSGNSFLNCNFQSLDGNLSDFSKCLDPDLNMFKDCSFPNNPEIESQLQLLKFNRIIKKT